MSGPAVEGQGEWKQLWVLLLEALDSDHELSELLEVNLGANG